MYPLKSANPFDVEEFENLESEQKTNDLYDTNLSDFTIDNDDF